MYRHFRGKGNLHVGKKGSKKTPFARGMTQLGDRSVDINEEIYEAYVYVLYGSKEAYVYVLYGSKEVTNINQLRYSKFKGKNDQEKKYVDLTTVPPWRSSLYLHSKRANRAAYIIKQATLSSASKPLLEDCGWNNDSSMNWVADPFLENILELIVNDFDVEDNENEEYFGEECESEDDDDET